MKLTFATVLCLTLTSVSLAQVATFETGFDGFGVAFDPDSAVALSTAFASEGVQSLEFTNTTGGNTGSDFRWVAQLNLDTAITDACISADPDGAVAFDLIVPDNGADWSQVTISGNSDLGAGWTQIGDITGGTPAPGTATFSYPYTSLGWGPGEGFYQMNFAINYGDADGEALSFHIDNVVVETTATSAQCAFVAVPEPSGLGLCLLALGSVMTIARRKK